MSSNRYQQVPMITTAPFDAMAELHTYDGVSMPYGSLLLVSAVGVSPRDDVQSMRDGVATRADMVAEYVRDEVGPTRARWLAYVNAVCAAAEAPVLTVERALAIAEDVAEEMGFVRHMASVRDGRLCLDVYPVRIDYAVATETGLRAHVMREIASITDTRGT